MNQSIYHIAWPNLLYVVVLVFVVALIYRQWSLDWKSVFYALGRMIGQLVLIGFLLSFIFSNKNKIIISLILLFMMLTAVWIALRPVKPYRRRLYLQAFFGLSAGGLTTLVLVMGGVIRLMPWHEPRYLIPIAGMIFASSMNSISLAADRFYAEIQKGTADSKAKGAALQTALLPITNSFLAVGLVSLPGMMTGQILAGVSPLIAVRYQIMVMCMLFGASGISSAVFLSFLRGNYFKPGV